MSIVKTIRKAVTKPKIEPQPKEPEYKYKVVVKMNNDVLTCETDDIKSALQELKPTVFKSRVVITVSNAYDSVERVMMIAKARLLFRNDLTMQVFVKNILLALKNN